MLSSSQITRRQLLKGATAVALAPTLARAQSRPFRMAFFSDTHIGLGRNIEECRAMLKAIRTEGVDLALNVGDVTDYGWAGEYAIWKELLAEFETPVLHVPGNHDVRWSPFGLKAFETVCGPPYSSSEAGGILWIQLDSSVPLSHYGHIETPQSAWLRKTLQEWGRERPIVVSAHHWFGRDRTMIDNQEEVYSLLSAYNVVAILAGHGHADLAWQWGRFPCFMNKGLYQGSYCLLSASATELVIQRRTAERPLTEISRLSLIPQPRPAEPTVVGEISMAEAAAIRGVTEWNGKLGASQPTMPGVHLLAAQNQSVRTSARVRIPIPKEAPLQIAYRKRLPGGVMSHLRLREGVLYISMMDGTVMAVRASDGVTLWTFQTGGYCHSSPHVFGRWVYVGSADASLYALDCVTGKLAWKTTTEGPIYGSPVVVKGAVVFSGGDGLVRAFEADSGLPRWTFAVRPRGVPPFSQSQAVTDGNLVFMGMWDTQIYAFNPMNGQPVWLKKATDKNFAYSPAIGSPVVSRGRLYAVANSNALLCYDAATGEKQWEVASPGEKFGYSSPLLMGSMIVAGCLGDDRGEVRGVSALDGRELWATQTGFSIYDSSACQMGRYIAIGSVDSVLNLLEARTGRLVQQLRLPPGHFLSSPTASARRLYAATFNGELWALDLVTR